MILLTYVAQLLGIVLLIAALPPALRHVTREHRRGAPRAPRRPAGAR